MKLKMHTSAEEKRAELSKIKNFMEIGILLLAGLEILCEFFYTRYFDYVIASISFAECGLFLYGYLLHFILIGRLEFAAEKYDTLIDFHNTFMTSIIVPLIFIFSNSNTSFENTRITNPELLKKITVLIVLGVMFYYKMIHFVLKNSKTETLTDEVKRQYQHRINGFVFGGFCADMLVMGCVMLYFMAMLNKEESLAIFAGLLAALIVIDIAVFNRIEEKKPILRIVILAFTAFFAFYGVYNVYLQKDAQEFHFEKTDYCRVSQGADGSKLEQYCRFEDGENGKEILKYVIVYTDGEGQVQTGTSIYEFTAIEPIKGFFRWYDTEPVYMKRKEIGKDETPAVISVSRENSQCQEDFVCAKYLTNDHYAYKGAQGDEREWLAVGEQHLKFRNTIMQETQAVSDAVEAILDAMTFEGPQ